MGIGNTLYETYRKEKKLADDRKAYEKRKREENIASYRRMVFGEEKGEWKKKQ